MPKSTYLYLLFAIALAACQHEQLKSFTPIHLTEIQHLHQQATESKGDSAYQYLQEAKQQIQSFTQLPDSLKAINNYQLGLYFFDTGQLDSASIYFHQAIGSIQDSIKHETEVDYFRKAWSAYFRQAKYGDCISIKQRLKEMITPDDYKYQALIHFFDENISKRKRDATKALKSNQLRIGMLRLAGDTSSVITALISQAAIKSTMKGGLSESIEISEDLIAREADLSDNQKRLLFGNYGVYLFHKKAFKASRAAYLKGLSSIPDIPGKRDLLATAYSNLAEVSMELKDYSAAKTYLDSVETLGLRNIAETYRKSTMQYKLRLAVQTENNIDEVLSYMDTIFKIHTIKNYTSWKRPMKKRKSSLQKGKLRILKT